MSEFKRLKSSRPPSMRNGEDNGQRRNWHEISRGVNDETIILSCKELNVKRG